jgi:hypothetical protein
MLRYRSGEDVQVGDVVITGNGKRGIVKLLIYPGTPDTQYWACPDGGILVEEDWNGTPNLMAYPADAREEWEDLDFVKRGTTTAS